MQSVMLFPGRQYIRLTRQGKAGQGRKNQGNAAAGRGGQISVQAATGAEDEGGKHLRHVITARALRPAAVVAPACPFAVAVATLVPLPAPAAVPAPLPSLLLRYCRWLLAAGPAPGKIFPPRLVSTSKSPLERPATGRRVGRQAEAAQTTAQVGSCWLRLSLNANRHQPAISLQQPCVAATDPLHGSRRRAADGRRHHLLVSACIQTALHPLYHTPVVAQASLAAGR
jgi:hypothetical protein